MFLKKVKEFIKYNFLFFSISIICSVLDIFTKYFMFSLIWNAVIFTPVNGFKIPALSSETLEKGAVSKELRTLFEENGVFLTKNALIKNFGILNQYWIYDKEKYFIVFEKESGIVFKSKYQIPGEHYQINHFLFVPPNYKNIQVIPEFFDLRIALNLGAVWSSFQGKKNMLTILSLVAIFFIFYILFKNKYSGLWQLSLGFIMSGAIGNLWDRIFFGGVRDFLDVYVDKYHWPTFNFADVFIVSGIAIFIFIEWRADKKEKT